MKYNTEIIDYTVSDEFWKREQLPEIFDGYKLLANINGSGLIIYHEDQVNYTDLSGKQIWSAPLIIDDIPNAAHVSGNRLILTTNTKHYHAWGVLGPVYLIDIEKGTIIKQLKGERAAALANGAFIVALTGYGAFDTWCYDKNGEIKDEWKSFGNYLVIDNTICVAERERSVHIKAHLVKLLPNGKIQEGEELTRGEASNLLPLTDTDFLFVNDGDLKIRNTNLEKIQDMKLLEFYNINAAKFMARIRKEGDFFFIEIVEMPRDNSTPCKTHCWKIKISNAI